jgi:hypothetical protein
LSPERPPFCPLGVIRTKQSASSWPLVRWPPFGSPPCPSRGIPDRHLGARGRTAGAMDRRRPCECVVPADARARLPGPARGPSHVLTVSG